MPEDPPNALAVITGASSGIGAEFARQLSKRGYRLLLVARREERLTALAGELAVPAEIMVADLSVESDCARVAERIRGAENLSLLVNNAGFGTLGLFPQTDLESQQRMHKLHVLAAMTLSHVALGNLTAREKAGGFSDGRPRGIINVASVASFGQSPQNVSYCATKAWMASFSEGLAIELGSKRSAIRVQALCPGFTYSEFHDVLKMDRRAIPKSWWLTAEFVVRKSLEAFAHGDALVIPGWRYRLLVSFIKLTPTGLKRATSIWWARHRNERAKPE